MGMIHLSGVGLKIPFYQVPRGTQAGTVLRNRDQASSSIWGIPETYSLYILRREKCLLKLHQSRGLIDLR